MLVFSLHEKWLDETFLNYILSFVFGVFQTKPTVLPHSLINIRLFSAYNLVQSLCAAGLWYQSHPITAIFHYLRGTTYSLQGSIMLFFQVISPVPLIFERFFPGAGLVKAHHSFRGDIKMNPATVITILHNCQKNNHLRETPIKKAQFSTFVMFK